MQHDAAVQAAAALVKFPTNEELVQASIQATRCILLTMSRMVTRHTTSNLLRVLLSWKTITSHSKLAESCFDRTEARIAALEISSNKKLGRNQQMARCAVLAQVIRQQIAGRLLYGFTTWSVRLTALSSSQVGSNHQRAAEPVATAAISDQAAVTALLGLLRVSVDSDVSLLQGLSDAEIHQMVRVLKTERSAIKTSGEASELNLLAAAVLAEANRRIGSPSPSQTNPNQTNRRVVRQALPARAPPVCQEANRRPLPCAPTTIEIIAPVEPSSTSAPDDAGSKFEMDQAHVEEALSQYQHQRLMAEETRLEHQAVRVAKAEAAASIGSSPLNLKEWSKILRPKHY